MTFKRLLNTQTVRFLLVLPFLALLLIACGPDSLQGRVVLSGSSTLAPLLSRAAEQWKKLHPRVDIRVEAIGSDAGLERLIRFDDADLALVSRPLAPRDRDAAAAVGKELLPLPLAWDAVSLVVPESNTWAQSLSKEQVVKAFTSAVLWSDLDPSWPRLTLHRFVLGPKSGTADIFAAALLGGDRAKLFTGKEIQSSEDDGILARGVAQVDGAIGFLGWTTVKESGLPLRMVALDGVDPSQETISSRAYGLPRQLWMVANRAAWKEHAVVRAFVHFLYERYPEVLAGSSLVPLSANERRSVESILTPSL